MAIDRVALTTLSIPERIARDQPGRQLARQPEPAPLPVPAGGPDTVGALLQALDAQPVTGSLSNALAGKLAAEALLHAEPGAMQSNHQIFLSRQLTWQTPDVNVMAGSWLVMVRNYAEQRGALLQQTQGRHLPSGLFQSDQAPAVLRDGRVPLQLVAETEAWKFAVYAWGAEKLLLRVIVRDPDQDEEGAHARPGPRRRSPRIALRLELFLGNLGKVVVQLEPLVDGVLLEIGAAQAGAMAHMRAMLPQIAAVARGCGVRIGRVRMMRQLPPAASREPTPRQVAALTPALFRTMAEVALLLSQPLPADELFLETLPRT